MGGSLSRGPLGFHPKPRQGTPATSIVVPGTAVPTGCSIALAALPLATAVSLPRSGSLCRYAATGHRPKGRASQISDLSRAIPPFGRNWLAAERGQPALRRTSIPHLGLRPKPRASRLARSLFLPEMKLRKRGCIFRHLIGFFHKLKPPAQLLDRAIQAFFHWGDCSPVYSFTSRSTSAAGPVRMILGPVAVSCKEKRISLASRLIW